MFVLKAPIILLAHQNTFALMCRCTASVIQALFSSSSLDFQEHWDHNRVAKHDSHSDSKVHHYKQASTTQIWFLQQAKCQTLAQDLSAKQGKPLAYPRQLHALLFITVMLD